MILLPPHCNFNQPISALFNFLRKKYLTTEEVLCVWVMKLCLLAANSPYTIYEIIVKKAVNLLYLTSGVYAYLGTVVNNNQAVTLVTNDPKSQAQIQVESYLEFFPITLSRGVCRGPP